MIIFPEDKVVVSLLSGEDAQQLLLALFSESGDVPPLSPLAQMAYTAIKSKSDRISEKKSRAGRSGGAPPNNQNAKKQAEQAEQADGAKTTYRTSTVPLPYHTTTVTEGIPPIPPKGGGVFESFWAAYPKKKSKGAAEKAWKSINPSKELVATMLEKLAQAKTCPDWTKDAGQFIPYPATWLRAKGWEDEYQATGYRYGGDSGGDKDGDSL